VVVFAVAGPSYIGDGGDRPGAGAGLVILVVAIGTVLIFSLGSGRFWLPPESFTFKDRGTFTGYLLRGSEDYLIIFEERRRILTEESKDKLIDREFCRLRIGDVTGPKTRAGRYLPKCP
jgi:hypothetical protein